MKAKHPSRLSFLSGAIALSLATTIPAQATLFDFNSSGQLTDNFYLTGAGTIQPSQNAAGGLGNSGWVTTATGTGSSERTSLVTRTTAGSIQNSFTMSVYFQWDQERLANPGETMGLGIGYAETGQFAPVAGGTTGSSDPAPYPGVNQFHIGLGLGNVTVDGQPTRRVRVTGTSVADGRITNFTSGSSATYSADLVQGNWYYLEVDFLLNPTENGYNASLRLVNSDDNGVLGSNIFTYDYGFVNAALVSGDIHGYLLHRPGYYGGITGFDNYTVGFEPIPEPSTTAALLIGAACLGWNLRRKSAR